MVELSGEDRVPIMNEKPVSSLAWDRFPKLLCGPFCRGVGSHIAMQNPPRTQFQNDEGRETGNGRLPPPKSRRLLSRSRDCERRSSIVVKKPFSRGNQ